MKVTTSVLQNSFGKYLKFAESGAEITITKNGRDTAILKGIIDQYNGETAGLYQAEKRMTYDEFKEMNTEEGRYEFIDGYVCLQAYPGNQHQMISRTILFSIGNYILSQSCEIFNTPYDVVLNPVNRPEPVSVQPDILIFCDKENIVDDRYKGPPLIVMEILSSNRNYDMLKKLDVYSTSGIKEYWIIDPVNQCIIIYNFKENSIDSIDKFSLGDTVKSNTFEGLSLAVDLLFN